MADDLDTKVATDVLAERGQVRSQTKALEPRRVEPMGEGLQIVLEARNLFDHFRERGARLRVVGRGGERSQSDQRQSESLAEVVVNLLGQVFALLLLRVNQPCVQVGARLLRLCAARDIGGGGDRIE